MKHYPSITKEVFHNLDIWAFNKLDGSQIRAEWNNKKGFYKFGSKNQLIDASTKPWGRAVQLVNDKYADAFKDIAVAHGWRDAICFLELWGTSSFAGTHDWKEELTVTLFDVNPYKQGIMEPEPFLTTFGHLDIPSLVYRGPVTVELFDQVKQSTLPGMSLEGVVCKAPSLTGAHLPTMFKIKSKAWLDKLRLHCKGNQKLFAMLE